MTGQSPCSPRNSPTHAPRQRAPQNHGAQHPPHPHSPTPIPTLQPPAPGIRLVVCPHSRNRIPNMSYLQEAYSPSTLPHERGRLPSNVHKLPKRHATPTRKILRILQKKSTSQTNRARPKRRPRQNSIQPPRQSTSAMARRSRPLERHGHRNLRHSNEDIHHHL